MGYVITQKFHIPQCVNGTTEIKPEEQRLKSVLKLYSVLTIFMLTYIVIMFGSIFQNATSSVVIELL